MFYASKKMVIISNTRFRAVSYNAIFDILNFVCDRIMKITSYMIIILKIR